MQSAIRKTQRFPYASFLSRSSMLDYKCNTQIHRTMPRTLTDGTLWPDSCSVQQHKPPNTAIAEDMALDCALFDCAGKATKRCFFTERECQLALSPPTQSPFQMFFFCSYCSDRRFISSYPKPFSDVFFFCSYCSDRRFISSYPKPFSDVFFFVRIVPTAVRVPRDGRRRSPHSRHHGHVSVVMR
jgi:hypothetical protein